MKVIGKQRNSRMCVICGLDNPGGVRAPFYNMEDGSAMTRFRFLDIHQSYPGRVHGGVITAMLDELGLRGLWAKAGNESVFGVTVTLESHFRKPVPYGCDLLARGVLVSQTSRFFTVEAAVMDLYGRVLADGVLKYLKLDPSVISAGVDVHEQMPYLVEDGVEGIDYLV
ncbi:MAG: PaaI family thioesterase [Victivallaceae bacterium]|nr:PaaI family thioesterase [Victivallaceae bacterium]